MIHANYRPTLSLDHFSDGHVITRLSGKFLHPRGSKVQRRESRTDILSDRGPCDGGAVSSYGALSANTAVLAQELRRRAESWRSAAASSARWIGSRRKPKASEQRCRALLDIFASQTDAAQRLAADAKRETGGEPGHACVHA